MKISYFIAIFITINSSVFAGDFNIKLRSVIGGEAMRHGDRITKLIPLPGGKIIGASEDGIFRIWDVEKNKEIKRFKAIKGIKSGSDEVWNIQLHPDGKKVLTAHDNGFIHVWDLKKDKPIRTFNNGKRVFRLAILPNGKNFLAVDTVGKVKIGDLSKEENTLKTIGKHTDDAYTVAVSLDGKSAWTGGDNKILGWDLTKNSVSGKDYDNDEEIYTITTSPDSKKLVVTADDSNLMLLDSETMKVIWKKVFKADGYVAAWTPDGKNIVTTGKEITIIDALTGDVIKSIPISGPKHSSVALSQDGKQIFSGDKIIYRYNLKTGKQIFPEEKSAIIEGDLDTVKILDSGKVYVVIDKRVEVWNLNNKRESVLKFDSNVDRMSFSKDESRFIIALDKSVHVYETESNKEITKLAVDDGGDFVDFIGLNTLLVKMGSAEYSLFNYKEARTLKTYPVSDVRAISANGAFFLTSKSKQPIKVWDVKTGNNIGTFDLFEDKDSINDVSFIPGSNSFLAIEDNIMGGGVLLKKEKEVPKQEFDKLVKALGSNSYKERESATKKLIQFGTKLIPTLEKLENAKDPEVRMRLREVKENLHKIQNLPKKLEKYFDHDENLEGIKVHPSKPLWAAQVEQNSVRGKIVIGGFEKGKPVIFQTVFEGRGLVKLSFDRSGKRLAVANRDATVSVYDISKKETK